MERENAGKSKSSQLRKIEEERVREAKKALETLKKANKMYSESNGMMTNFIGNSKKY
jgi:restriction endonuclease